jgi:hypothetical protein
VDYSVLQLVLHVYLKVTYYESANAEVSINVLIIKTLYRRKVKLERWPLVKET